VPKGYKLAWDDDRLNPMRGVGTMQGQAQQDQVWTRDVPAQTYTLVAPTSAGGKAQVVISSKSAQRKSQVVVATKTAPTAAVPQAKAQRVAPAVGGSFYVQVGTFGEPANAEGVRARLRSAGLPVGTSKITKGGRAMQIVLTGPYADSGSAQAALRAVRGAGFGDAFIR
jgi:cell division protein FtsN